MTKSWTPTQTLEAWANVYSGARSLGVRPKGYEKRGDRPGLTPDEQAFFHVCALPGYGITRPVLAHIMVALRSIKTYRWPADLPASKARGRAIAQGYGQAPHLNETQLAKLLLRKFYEKLSQTPFFPAE